MRTARAYAVKRHTDPQTSLFAADSVKDISGVQRRILHILEDGKPRTDSEIERDYRTLWGNTASAQSLRTRRRELCDPPLSLVRFSGEHGTTPFGNPSRKWTVA